MNHSTIKAAIQNTFSAKKNSLEIKNLSGLCNPEIQEDHLPGATGSEIGAPVAGSFL